LGLTGDEKLNEQELVKKAREGDRNAFKELVQRYENQVAATVIGMLGNTPEAEDIGQETFIRFYLSLNRFRGESSVGTYLTRIAINLSLNALKKRRRHLQRSVSDPEPAIRNVPVKDPSAQRRDLQRLVHHAIQQLEPKYRSVIVLRLIDGYTTRETAEILKVPAGTVLSRLSRAQARLKDILAPLYWEKLET